MTPVTKATSVPTTSAVPMDDDRVGSARTSRDFNTTAPKMAGIEMRKEKSPASFLSIPKSIDRAMVEPDRDIPGIMASPCTIPIRSAVLYPKVAVPPARNREEKIMIPVKKRVHDTISGLSNSDSSGVLNIMPMRPVGTQATTIRRVLLIDSGSFLNNPLIRDMILCLKTKTVASNVPKWSIRSKTTPSLTFPRSELKITRCPLLLTGRNSVRP